MGDGTVTSPTIGRCYLSCLACLGVEPGGRFSRTAFRSGMVGSAEQQHYNNSAPAGMCFRSRMPVIFGFGARRAGGSGGYWRKGWSHQFRVTAQACAPKVARSRCSLSARALCFLRRIATIAHTETPTAAKAASANNEWRSCTRSEGGTRKYRSYKTYTCAPPVLPGIQVSRINILRSTRNDPFVATLDLAGV